MEDTSISIHNLHRKSSLIYTYIYIRINIKNASHSYENGGERGANYKEEVVNLHEMRHTISRKANEANTSKLSN